MTITTVPHHGVLTIIIRRPMRILLIGLGLLLLFANFLGDAIPVEDVSQRMYSTLLSAARRGQHPPASEQTPPSQVKSINERLRDLDHVRQRIAVLEENMDKISEKNRGYFKDVLTNYRNDELVLRQGLKNEDIRSFHEQERRKSAQQRQKDMNEILASNRQRSRDQQEQFYRNLELHQARMANQLQRISDMRERSPMTIQRN